jgi:hypothetical protein
MVSSKEPSLRIPLAELPKRKKLCYQSPPHLSLKFSGK